MTSVTSAPDQSRGFGCQRFPAIRIYGVEVMLKNFLSDETGLELSEYAVAAALVAIAVAGVFAALGDAITVKINELGGHIASGS